ncbi:hypothetical protein IU459_30240 [Nocardia amamiensis]|uniref:DUF3618 domain-containing protein n=1 Tax=Nocardia amamiensis TaxID=404578 RepID=A0ABS0CYY4_9NOCA|nr:hypothetical protein [Nocardia amamiensis]MBF6301791.1 hypothetical protein [Nocardia amamiensis]
MSGSRSPTGAHGDGAAALRHARDTARKELDKAVEELGHKLDDAPWSKGKAREAVESTQHAVSEAAHAVSDKAEQAKTSAADLAHRIAAATPAPRLARGRHAAGKLRPPPVSAVLIAAGVAILVWRILRSRR